MDKQHKHDHHEDPHDMGAESAEKPNGKGEENKAADVPEGDGGGIREVCDTVKDNEVKKLTDELETLKDLMQRRQADFENYKKRQMKIQQDQNKLAIKDFALDIIEINDDLLRAIAASGTIENNGTLEQTHRSFVDGVTMISKRIEDTLGKYGIVEIDSLNRPFDPNYNEAVEIEMSADHDIDTVTKVHQKGFRIDDIVLRHAKVKVAKAAKPQGEGDGRGNDSCDQQGNDPG